MFCQWGPHVHSSYFSLHFVWRLCSPVCSAVPLWIESGHPCSPVASFGAGGTFRVITKFHCRCRRVLPERLRAVLQAFSAAGFAGWRCTGAVWAQPAGAAAVTGSRAGLQKGIPSKIVWECLIFLSKDALYGRRECHSVIHFSGWTYAWKLGNLKVRSSTSALYLLLWASCGVCLKTANMSHASCHDNIWWIRILSFVSSCIPKLIIVRSECIGTEKWNGAVNTFQGRKSMNRGAVRNLKAGTDRGFAHHAHVGWKGGRQSQDGLEFCESVSRSQWQILWKL